jgi:lipoate-protein ligase A
MLVNQLQGLAYTIADENLAFVPARGLVDEQLCYELGYKVYEAQYGGGIIITNLGDIDIAYFGQPGNTFHSDFCKYFTEWLINIKGLKAECTKNDVLVDNYKVSGNGVIRHSGIEYSVIHIGINTNLENIKKICKKPMKKVPKGLSEYGITTEEVEQMFLDFCQLNNQES